MSISLEWLPPIASVDGEFAKVIAGLYNIFHRDFLENKPKLDSMDVWYDREVKPGETYEEGFWHLITRDFAQDDSRTFDPKRAERLPWCSPVINHFKHVAVKYWTCKEKSEHVCYIWLEGHDYVVIFEKKTLKAKVVNGVELKERKIAFLKTAYYLDGKSKRRSLSKKYERRIA